VARYVRRDVAFGTLNGNMLTAPDGRAGLIDPAVSYGWPETDVSMAWCRRGDLVPDRYLLVSHRFARRIISGIRETSFEVLPRCVT
jgi:hypothetical protein